MNQVLLTDNSPVPFYTFLGVTIVKVQAELDLLTKWHYVEKQLSRQSTEVDAKRGGTKGVRENLVSEAVRGIKKTKGSRYNAVYAEYVVCGSENDETVFEDRCPDKLPDNIEF